MDQRREEIKVGRSGYSIVFSNIMVTLTKALAMKEKNGYFFWKYS